MVRKIYDHEPVGDMPDEVDIDRIIEFVSALGLHGILLVSKPCANCGQLHDFAVASDLQDYEDVPHVLARYAKVTARSAPPTIKRKRKAN